MTRVVAIAGLLLLTTAMVMGQLIPNGVAVSADFGNGSTIGGAFALSADRRVNFGLGFGSTSPDSGVSQSSFTVQTGMWFYRPAHENVSVFYGGAVRFIASTGIRRSGDLGISLQAGAEYSFSRRFGIGTCFGFDFQTGDRSANGLKGTNWGIAGTSIFLTWWFL